MKKSAFTLLELVFVIVVAGILAAALIPRFDRDTLYEAAEQLQSHIKYTQHLALMDDVYDAANTDWYKNRWRITFDDTDDRYAVSKGVTTNGIYAKDPLTKNDINGLSGGNAYDLNDKYSVTFTLPGGGNVLAFDQLGRPYVFNGDQTAPTSDVRQTDFNISITDGTDTFIISVTPETGFTYIDFD